MKYLITKDSGQSIVVSTWELLIITGIQRRKGYTIAQVDMARWLDTGRIINPIRMGNITIVEEVENE